MISVCPCPRITLISPLSNAQKAGSVPHPGPAIFFPCDHLEDYVLKIWPFTLTQAIGPGHPNTFNIQPHLTSTKTHRSLGQRP
jgi:hypothetical protein